MGWSPAISHRGHATSGSAHCCLRVRLSHKSPSDPVCRSVMGRSILRRRQIASKWDDTLVRSRIARRLPPLSFLSFSDPFTRQPRLKAAAPRRGPDTSKERSHDLASASRRMASASQFNNSISPGRQVLSNPRFERTVQTQDGEPALCPAPSGSGCLLARRWLLSEVHFHRAVVIRLHPCRIRCSGPRPADLASRERWSAVAPQRGVVDA